MLGDHLANEPEHASAGQLAGAGIAAALLVAGAFRMGRRTPTQRAGAAPSPWLVAPAAFVIGLGSQLLPPSPLGTDALVLVYASGATAIWWLSGRPAGRGRMPPRSRSGALSAFALMAFWTDPIGQVTEAEKLGHNIGLLVLVAASAVLAVRRAGVRAARERAGVTGCHSQGDSTVDTELVIAGRFRGPARSGNGGYSAGSLAALAPGDWGAITVRLSAPPPLDIAMTVTRSERAPRRVVDGAEIARGPAADHDPTPVAAGRRRDRAGRGGDVRRPHRAPVPDLLLVRHRRASPATGCGSSPVRSATGGWPRPGRRTRAWPPTGTSTATPLARSVTR